MDLLRRLAIALPLALLGQVLAIAIATLVGDSIGGSLNAGLVQLFLIWLAVVLLAAAAAVWMASLPGTGQMPPRIRWLRALGAALLASILATAAAAFLPF
jgi:hypothetical protein